MIRYRVVESSEQNGECVLEERMWGLFWVVVAIGSRDSLERIVKEIVW